MPIPSRLAPSACLSLVLAVGLLAPPTARAETPPATPDTEEQVDEGLKGFGYLTGLALGCVVKEQRPALEREAMDLSAAISRLLGLDRAFLFTAAFGYGASVEIKTEECKTVLERYEARVAAFRQGKGGKR